MADFFVNISNNIIVNDNEEDQLVPLNVNISDSITVVEGDGYLLQGIISISETITVVESLTEDIRKESYVSDTITVGESNDELLPALNISKSDLITVSDIEDELVPALNISIFETITISESSVFLNILYSALFEVLTIAEYVHGNIAWDCQVFDSILVSDTEDELVPGLHISKSDSITIAESVSLLIPQLYLSKNDAVTIAESIITLGKLYRAVSTSIVISDIEDELDIIHISKFDSIKVIDRFIKAPIDPSFTIPNTISSVHTMLTSAQRSAGTAYSDSFKVKSTMMTRFHIQITAISGIPTLVITPQVSPDNSIWYNETAFDTMYQADNYTNTLLFPGAYVRLKYVIAGSSTPKVTFSAKLVKHMPVRELTFV